MERVGLRELKNRLSEYVRRVRAGQGFLVTDRGQAVAELRPPGAPGESPPTEPGLVSLARRGSITLGAPNDPGVYTPLPQVLPPGTAQRLLNEERSEG